MQRLDVVVERRPHRRERGRRRQVHAHRLQRRVDRRGETPHHAAFAGLRRVQLQAELAESGFDQPRVHDVERRHLLGHEQHGLPAGQSLRDEVRDGLRLPGAGWPLEHQIVPARHAGDCAQLTRVRVDDLSRRLGRELAIELEPPHIIGQSDHAVAFTTDQLPDESMSLDGGRVRLEILVHHELLEREQPEHHVGRHGPATAPGDRLRQRREERLEIVVIPDGRGIRQVRERDPEIESQILGQRGVDDGIILGRAKSIARPRRLSRQLHRQQHDGCAERLLRHVRLGVSQHAESEEERVDALFLDREARLLVEAAQRPVERFSDRARLQHVVRVTVVERRRIVRNELGSPRRDRRRVRVCMGAQAPVRGAGLARLDRVRGWILDRRGLRRRESHLAPGEVQRPEDLGRVLVDDRYRRHARRPEVQRAVSLREVEQLPLPRVDGCGNTAVDVNGR